MQPCKPYFGEQGIRTWAGTAAGRGHEKEIREERKGKERARERKKGVKSNNPSGRGKECRGG